MSKSILITNDDGVHAHGIGTLKKSLSSSGHTVFVVAPDSERSGASHSITLTNPLRISQHDKTTFSVDGTPVDAAFIGLGDALPISSPNLVVSGINRGGNLGDDILYSGTVAAASEAYRHGIPAIAVSLFSSTPESLSSAAFTTAAQLFSDTLLPRILSVTETVYEETPFLINVNIPTVALGRPSPVIRWTKPGKRHYGGAIITRTDPRGGEYHWIGGNQHAFEDIPDSDCNAVFSGEISFSPLAFSLSDNNALEKITEGD